MDAISILSRDLQVKDEFRRLIKAHEGQKEFIYAGHICRVCGSKQREKLESVSIVSSASNHPIYTMNKFISYIGEKCELQFASHIDTLDLVMVEEIKNTDFFKSFTNLRVLIANNLKSFPSEDCLLCLSNLRYIEVERMKEVNTQIPSSVRVLLSAESYLEY